MLSVSCKDVSSQYSFQCWTKKYSNPTDPPDQSEYVARDRGPQGDSTSKQCTDGLRHLLLDEVAALCKQIISNFFGGKCFIFTSANRMAQATVWLGMSRRRTMKQTLQ